jgi:formylglycine-generating enzyme required for sulfatase activity
MTPIEIYALLPPAAQKACGKVASALFSKGVGFVVGKIKAEDAIATVYREFEKSFQDLDQPDDKLNSVFAEFFCRKRVGKELAKLRRDGYKDVDFKVLGEDLRGSFEFAGCPPPDGNLSQEIDSWVGELRELLKDEGVGAPRPDPRPSEAPVENDTLARQKYLTWVSREHRNIQFSGMAVVDEQSEVELARVFVMPRLIRQSDSNKPAAEKPAAAANKILTAKKCPPRLVILGGPGSGKTTLLEALALAFIQTKPFPWAHKFPNLLPVFYRIRDLDKDLETHGTIWDCIQHQCSRRMGETLPLGFFLRQMQTGGIALLFDGLDEASSLARRNQIVDLIGALADRLPPTSRVLVTSRPHDYRHRFESAGWAHFELAQFDDAEIQTFIKGWQDIHEPDQAAAEQKGSDLWKALESRKDILPLARNALLLTMIVRVHFGLGALPDSRLGLYEKCTETLLKHWARAAGLPESPIDTPQKHKLLARLAYEMQGEVEKLDPGLALQISRSDLARKFETYLRDEGCPNAFHLVERVVDRLHARDAILVQYGTDKRGQDLFGFVHRSFQEYFAASWMAQELEEAEFAEHLVESRDGWDETLYLAVAQLPDKLRRKTLLELLKTGRAGFAVECLKAAVPEQPWLRLMVQFLGRYTAEGSTFRSLPVSSCADACAGRPETGEVLGAMFEQQNREGQSLAAAVELAEELMRRGQTEAATLLDGFYSEATSLREDMVEIAAGVFPYGDSNELVDVAAFSIDRFPVTNEEYERMIPAHRGFRDEISNTDRQPVIYVSWFEARLYARWRGRGCRRPTEQEWEKAAAWDSASQIKRVYPWGDAFDAARCNTAESGLEKTTPVDAYPDGASAGGVWDMTGNVWEWTESLWSEGDELRVLRGGSWLHNHDYAACAYRNLDLPDLRGSLIGFRCART